MIELIGVLLGLAGLGFGVWRNKKSARFEARLEQKLEDYRDEVASQVRTVLDAAPNTGPLEVNQIDSPPTGRAHLIEYADVNHDGEKELLISYPSGVHGATLKVFEWEFGDLKEVAAFGSTTGAIEVKDYDHDGRLEIVTHQSDYSTNLPYVAAPVYQEVFRWEDGEYRHVDTVKN